MRDTLLMFSTAAALRRSVPLCLAVSFVAGCKDEPTPKPAPDKNEAPASSAAASASVATASSATPATQPTDACKAAPPGYKRVALKIAAPTVKLIEPGNEPREPLRYRFVDGKATRLKIDIAMGLMLVGHIRCVDGDGATVELRPQIGDHEPPANAFFFTKFSDRGLPSSAFFYVTEGDAARSNEDAAAFGTEVIPFPAEAVGVGAVWQVTATADPEVVEQTKYTLAKREGMAIELEVSLTQDLTDDAPSERIGVTGTAKAKLNLDELFPSTARSMSGPGLPDKGGASAVVRPRKDCTEACARTGRCHLFEGTSPDGDQCIAFSHADCWFSQACRKGGKCELGFETCEASGALPDLDDTEGDTISDEQRELIKNYLDSAAEQDEPKP